ncbi:hypothetical protein [Paraburkholderia sp.]|uniref:hypothetical protein n=1 Tax=Paraburkholderia sp. TaxID=1926495 RepID=UPI003C7E0FD7
MTQSVSKDAVNATQITLVTAVQLADTLRAQRDAIAESLAASVLPLLDLRLHAEKLDLKELVGELELKLGRARAALSSLNEYVLYSASAEQRMSHGGFWSHDCGWGAFETATRFSAGEKAPDAALREGADTILKSYADAAFHDAHRLAKVRSMFEGDTFAKPIRQILYIPDPANDAELVDGSDPRFRQPGAIEFGRQFTSAKLTEEALRGHLLEEELTGRRLKIDVFRTTLNGKFGSNELLFAVYHPDGSLMSHYFARALTSLA